MVILSSRQSNAALPGPWAPQPAACKIPWGGLYCYEIRKLLTNNLFLHFLGGPMDLWKWHDNEQINSKLNHLTKYSGNRHGTIMKHHCNWNIFPMDDVSEQRNSLSEECLDGACTANVALHLITMTRDISKRKPPPRPRPIQPNLQPCPLHQKRISDWDRNEKSYHKKKNWHPEQLSIQ